MEAPHTARSSCPGGLALVTEFGEQFFFPGDVPSWVDALPPVLFTVAGLALVLAARARLPRVEGAERRTALS